jgi:aminoglycoside N3'-acetyltransferase
MSLSDIIFNRKIKLVRLADIIIYDLNIKRNDTLYVHSSFRKLKLSDSNPEDFTYLLKMLVGTQGTLLMPNFSDNQEIQKDRSFLAWGKMSVQISEDPLVDETGLEYNDLLERLSNLNAKIIGIGNPLNELPFVHASGFAQNKVKIFRRRGIPFFVLNTGTN